MPRRMLYARPGLAATLAVAVSLLGCQEPTAPLSPQRDLIGVVPLSHTRVTGLGAITPPGQRLDFNFDVNDTPSGWVAITWYYSENGGGVERFNVDPTNDPATQIVSFSQTSPTCVRFYGTGRQDDGELHFFWIDACDNANPGVGYDTFGLTSPPGFNSSGTLIQGDIAISTF